MGLFLGLYYMETHIELTGSDFLSPGHQTAAESTVLGHLARGRILLPAELLVSHLPFVAPAGSSAIVVLLSIRLSVGGSGADRCRIRNLLTQIHPQL